jgi:pyrroloquinoline quinone (PQQ) biosynthesis protein C
VKKLVWEHEKDELYCDPRFGGDHHSAALQKAMKMSGHSREELYAADLIPGCKAAFFAWLNLAKNSSWLRAFSGSTILERANNNAVVKGGGVSVRDYARFTEDVLKLIEKVAGHDVHNVADEEHSDMMEEVMDRYLKTEEDSREVLIGARDSLDFDRAFRGSLAVYLESIGE